MSLTKFASYEVSEVLDIKSSPEKAKSASLQTVSDFHNYRTDDGYLYVKIRAISSRVNKNHDGWPTIELAGGPEVWDKISSQHRAAEGGFRIESDTSQEYGFPTFIGKPIFVDHNNSDPKRARGVIADSAFNVLDHKTASEGDDYWGGDDVDPEHIPAAEIELLLEVDAKEFPKFAKQIVDGDLDGFSMGCDVDFSRCSHCGNEATSPQEYCSHIVMKGAEHTFESGEKKGKHGRSYENCYGVKFFEISGVFEPADETALAKEVRAAKVAALEKEADGVYHEPAVEEIEQLARRMMVDNPGMTLEEAMPYAQSELMNRFAIDPSKVQIHGEGWSPDHIKVKDTMPVPRELPLLGVDVPPRYQGSYLASKTAEAPEPQSMHTKAPEDVNTLREEKVCPLCGSDMDSEKCDVCGYEEAPESLQNPDLSQAHDVDLTQQEDSQVTLPADEGTPPAQGEEQGESYLNARNKPNTASVKGDMRWVPKITIAADKPQGDEPNETVTSDQTAPVTSTFRTAQQLIAEAKRNQETKKMSDQSKVAADPADPSGKADKRVDVEGVGGVSEATNEEASKPEGPHGEPGVTVDVEGKGGVLQGTNEEASRPDETQSVEETSDNAGFDKGKRTDDSGPTKTWDNSNEPGSAVTDKAFPTAAKKGTDPVDPVGKPDERIDVEEPPHDRVGPGTDQWTGTGGNGVTKQQDPVTKKVDPNIEQPKSSGLISLAALRLADTEVELGITPKDDKYKRLAELSVMDESDVESEYRALSRVKKAGFSRTASKGGVGRLPSFNKIASPDPVTPQPVDDALLDSALYSR